jgi:GTP-binding nuclear protein Ran
LIQEFAAEIALKPAEVTIDQAVLDQYQKELADASAMPLPEEDDADL